MEEEGIMAASNIRDINVDTESHSEIVTKLKNELREWTTLSVSPCIYRIPEILRNGHEDSYTPQVISIGPYHSKRNNLHGMQLYKMKYLNDFLARSNNNLDTYVKIVQGLEVKFRMFYNEDIDLDSNELVQMILIDGVFLLEFIMKLAESPRDDDEIFKDNTSLRDDIIHDLILLENQLPLFVVTKLYSSINIVEESLESRLYNFCFRYFKQDERLFKKILQDCFSVFSFRNRSRILVNKRHLLDVLYDTCAVLPDVLPVELADVSLVEAPAQENESSFENLELSRSATELEEAGVRLEPSEDKIQTSIKFTNILLDNGTLEIPHLVVNRHTETIFRNLIAYEQCHRKGHIFRSYVIFMNCLIKSQSDMDLLIKLNIISNSFGQSKDVIRLFTHLYRIAQKRSLYFYYGSTCKELNDYKRDSWHRIKAAWFWAKVTWRRDYNTPWRIISVIAAVILLGLTLAQTICTIKQC